MNRIDRLFGIILLLHNKSRLRAQDLANTFEVSRRTIYRDITALSEMGVPVIALPGEGYELMEIPSSPNPGPESLGSKYA